jgi:hypothetical protein
VYTYSSTSYGLHGNLMNSSSVIFIYIANIKHIQWPDLLYGLYQNLQLFPPGYID